MYVCRKTAANKLQEKGPKASKSSSERTRRKPWETRRPEKQEGKGPGDHGTGPTKGPVTIGPRDQGAKGPVDQRTKGPEGPGEQQKRPIQEYVCFNHLFLIIFFL